MRIKILLFISFFAALTSSQAQSIIAKINFQNKNLIFGSLDNNLYSLNSDTKTTNWIFNSENPIYSSAEIKENKIFIGDSNAMVYCIGSDGKQVWKINLGTYNAIANKPTIIDNNLYVASASSLFVLDPRDGSTLGKFYADAAISSPISYKDNSIFIADSKGKIYKLSLEGALIESYQGASAAIFSKLIIDQNNLYFGSNDMNFYKFNLDEKKIVSKIPTNEWISSTSVIDGNLVFFGNDGGFFYCLDKTNMTTKWKFKAAASIRTESLIIGNKIFFGSDDKNLYVLDKTTGKLIKKFLAKEKIKSSPVLIENSVYFADESGEVYKISTDLTTIKTVFKTAGEISSPAPKVIETAKK